MLSNFALPWSAEAIFSRVWACVLARSNQFLSIFPISISTPALAALLRLQPPSKKQIKRSIDDFIESLDREAICALASRQYGGLQCSIRRQSMGSFNICFIIDFIDGTTRLVRLPLEPAVRDVWNKVRSEVYTMQYVFGLPGIRILLIVSAQILARQHRHPHPSSLRVWPKSTPTRTFDAASFPHIRIYRGQASRRQGTTKES